MPDAPPTRGTVLVVDDDPQLVDLVREALTLSGYAVEAFTSPAEALQAALAHDVDAVLTDVHMRVMDGIELCRQLSAGRPDLPVIVLTAFGSVETAVEAIRAGAFDFLSKPIDLDALEISINRAVAHHALTREVRRLRQLTEATQGERVLLGESPQMVHFRERLLRAARADVPVLISGETGTGKELAARRVHQLSSRAGGPFVAVNCAALPAPLLESELFGHVKGAFTDARTARRGLFVEAGDGVIFLDELGELPLALQPKLLRALQERTIRPVGADRDVPIRCRVVSATNRDLKADAGRGDFRGDLFYRLAVVRLELPPLRQRGRDILLLAQRFLTQAAERAQRPVVGFSRPAAQALLAYDWPGNVRELENCVEQGVAMTEHDHIVLDDLPDELRAPMSPRAEATLDGQLLPLESVERRHIERVMAAVNGNKSMAAQILGVDRSTLYRKLDRLGWGREGDDGAG